MMVQRLDNYYFFHAYLQYWEGSPVKYFLYVTSGGASPVFYRSMPRFYTLSSSLSGPSPVSAFVLESI
jgi:hypothetical protein